MIGYLKGKILSKTTNYVVVEVNNIGYRVLISPAGLKELVIGSQAEFFTWPYLRRETIDLYGCLSQQEFELFKLLEKMPGIGPKTALILASAGSLENLKKAIEQKDKEFLDKVKGVGQKKMQRVFLELTGRLKKMEGRVSSKDQEALDALIGLGFQKSAAKQALAALPPEIEKNEEKIKASLKILGR